MEGPGGGFPLKSPWEGETFYEGARGRFFEFLLQREAKFAQSGRQDVEGLGGVPYPPP